MKNQFKTRLIHITMRARSLKDMQLQREQTPFTENLNMMT